MTSIYKDLGSKKKKLSVTGLGYVGLPLALEFAKHFSVIGFDIASDRVALMKQGIDPSKELGPEAFENADIEFTDDPGRLKEAHFHIIGVPTDIDDHKVPDLKPILGASKSVGNALKKGDYVIFESTVYPGCTEEDCLPILEEEAGLKLGRDFKLGYSPERINPGDKEKSVTNILKIVSGSDDEALEEICKVYGQILENGMHRASSIKVAEAAKVIENTQRDLNISLMNELAIIFDMIGIDTREVLEAAGTKWNFHKYAPGLVGGHCISVDPYYLLHKAKQLGHDPQVIAAGRRVNDYIPLFISKRLVQTLTDLGRNPAEAKVLVMGITFKENVADIRNSKVVQMVKELMSFSVNVHVIDPYASPNEVAHEYQLSMIGKPEDNYDAIIVAVGHEDYINMSQDDLKAMMKPPGILFDIKKVFKHAPDDDMIYWTL